MKMYQLIQKLFGGGDSDRQTGDLISLLSFLKESRIKNSDDSRRYIGISFLSSLCCE
jgi:hypothetical protein